MRVRFAPSPTGYLHIGSARTFIFNWLYARHHNGTVILRIDDADIEDFALLRSNGTPTYHMASCADDVDLKISHIIRGQDHLTNTFKHVLIFEALGAEPPLFAHLPLLIAPDGAKLSKRKHGPV